MVNEIGNHVCHKPPADAHGRMTHRQGGKALHTQQTPYRLNPDHPVHVYFIGIGGVSMSGLAHILNNRGFTVSGSDRSPSEMTEMLEKQGVTVYYGQEEKNLTRPETPVDAVKPYLDRVDMVLVMGVHPGFGGQSYIPETTERLKAIRGMIDASGRDIRLEVDGGVNFDTLPEILEAGADTIVSGSCLFKGDIQANIEKFKQLF